MKKWLFLLPFFLVPKAHAVIINGVEYNYLYNPYIKTQQYVTALSTTNFTFSIYADIGHWTADQIMTQGREWNFNGVYPGQQIRLLASTTYEFDLENQVTTGIIRLLADEDNGTIQLRAINTYLTDGDLNFFPFGQIIGGIAPYFGIGYRLDGPADTLYLYSQGGEIWIDSDQTVVREALGFANGLGNPLQFNIEAGQGQVEFYGNNVAGVTQGHIILDLSRSSAAFFTGEDPTNNFVFNNFQVHVATLTSIDTRDLILQTATAGKSVVVNTTTTINGTLEATNFNLEHHPTIIADSYGFGAFSASLQGNNFGFPGSPIVSYSQPFYAATVYPAISFTDTGTGVITSGIVLGNSNVVIPFSANDGNLLLPAAGKIRFVSADNTKYVSLGSSSTLTAKIDFRLPTTTGTAAQVLNADGSGGMYWATVSAGGATPLNPTTTTVNIPYSLVTTSATLSDRLVVNGTTYHNNDVYVNVFSTSAVTVSSSASVVPLLTLDTTNYSIGVSSPILATALVNLAGGQKTNVLAMVRVLRDKPTAIFTDINQDISMNWTGTTGFPVRGFTSATRDNRSLISGSQDDTFAFSSSMIRSSTFTANDAITNSLSKLDGGRMIVTDQGNYTGTTLDSKFTASAVRNTITFSPTINKAGKVATFNAYGNITTFSNAPTLTAGAYIQTLVGYGVTATPSVVPSTSIGIGFYTQFLGTANTWGFVNDSAANDYMGHANSRTYWGVGDVNNPSGITGGPGNSYISYDGNDFILKANVTNSTSTIRLLSDVISTSTLSVSSTTNTGSLNVSGSSIGITTPITANSSSTFNEAVGSYIGGDGLAQQHYYRIYAFKQVGLSRAYSTYYIQTNDNDDDGSHVDQNYYNTVNWGAVTGASGYRILKYWAIDGTPQFNFNVYVDTATNSLRDASSSIFAHDPVLLPTTNYIDALILNGQVKDMYGYTNHYGSDTFHGPVNFDISPKVGGQNYLTIDSNLTNLFAGPNSGGSVTTGTSLLGIGESALKNVVDGFNNVCVGPVACQGVVSGQGNTVVGTPSGQSFDGSDVTILGSGNSQSATSLFNTVLVGDTAGANLTVASNNIGVGSHSLTGPTTGTYDIDLGSIGGPGGNFSNTITIQGIATADNQLVMGYYFASKIHDMYVGGGVTDSHGTDTLKIRTTGGDTSGSDIAGWNMELYPGMSRGAATPGTLKLYSSEAVASGTGAQTFYNRLGISATELAINDDSRIFDMRVEGDTDANLFFTKGSTDKVGIGNNAPAYKFDVTGAAQSTAAIITGDLSIKSGTSVSFAHAGGTLFTFVSSTGNTTTVETDLYVASVTANTLATSSSTILFSFGGTAVNSTSTKDIKVYFGTTTIFDTGALSTSASASWDMEGKITYSGSNIFKCIVLDATTGLSVLSGATFTRVGVVPTQGIIIKVTGTSAAIGAATNDIKAESGKVWWMP